MNKFSFLFLLLICTGLYANAQLAVATLFFKNNGIQVEDPDSMDYVRITQMPDSGSKLYTVKEFYANGNRKAIGKSNNIIPLNYEGPYLSFYQNGKRKRTENYKKGALVDTTYNFYPNGRLYSATFLIPDPDLMRFSTTGNEEICISMLKDSTGQDLVINGNGICKLYDADFKVVIDSGRVKNGHHDGVWTGDDQEYKLRYQENYAEGKLVSGESTDYDGTVRQYTKTHILPMFPGGMNGLFIYISKTMKYPTGAQERNAQGKVFVRFTIDKDGTLKNIFVTAGSTDPDLRAESLRVMEKSPKWLPEIRRGKAVDTIFNIPLSFTLSN